MSNRCLAIILSFFSMLAPLAGAKVPRPSPEYAVKLTDGRQLLLSSYRGKVVVLMFVTTTCPHCLATCQFMNKVQEQYGPKGLQTLAVTFNEMSRMLVPDFIKLAGDAFPIGWDDRDPVYNYLQRSPMLLTYVPIMVFIDRAGVIRGQYMGDDPFFSDRDKNVRAMIDKLIKEPASTTKAAHGKKAS